MVCFPSMLIFSLMLATITTHLLVRAHFNGTQLSTVEPPKNHYSIPHEEEITLRKVQERLKEVRNLSKSNLFFGIDYFIDELIEKKPSSWTYRDLMNILQRFVMGVEEISKDPNLFDSMSVRLLVDAFEDLGHLLDLSGGPDMKKTVKLLRNTVKSANSPDENLKGLISVIDLLYLSTNFPSHYYH